MRGTTMTEKIKIPVSDVGCWLEGGHGWHNSYRVVDTALVYGFQFDAETAEEDRASLELYRADDRSHDDYDDAWEVVCGQGGLVDQATEYLESLAPSGFHFEWDAGELSLLPCDQIEGHDPSDCV
jgi:hypothetical protein